MKKGLTDKQRGAIRTLSNFFARNIASSLSAIEDITDEMLVKDKAYSDIGDDLNDLVMDLIQEQIDLATRDFNYHSLPDDERDELFQAHYDLGYREVWKDHHILP